MAGGSYKGSEIKSPDQFLIDKEGLSSVREKEIGQHIGYRYDVNLLPDYSRLTPFLKAYIEYMGWDDLNWLEDVHMGYEEGEPAVFDRNCNGWVRTPKQLKLPADQQDRDMVARELLVKFQMSPDHPMVQLNKAYRKNGNPSGQVVGRPDDGDKSNERKATAIRDLTNGREAKRRIKSNGDDFGA
jgi:hypothetical protein